MRIFSGIQPTGDKTLGNYSGGFRQYAATQERGEAFFCVVDLHSITAEYDPEDLRESTLSLAAMLFATGLDPDRSTVFIQSHVDTHAQACWLLNAVTSFGELRRMTQFKEKSEQHEFVTSGLFEYPVLMAADILLYRTDLVPVGDDQRQHLELTRDIAERFNHRFGELFVIPEAEIPTVGGRIMDLQEPENRMSTTRGTPQGTVRILDEVDAPLDDANVGRFANKIAEMSEKTQFIVITHNKRTMEAARALYGVTMQEPGVSVVVSVKFE